MKSPKILILFYSMYGHVYEMAKAAAQGVEEAGGVVQLRQTPELIPEAKWNEPMKKAKEQMQQVMLAEPEKDLTDIDGLIMLVPTRFGSMPAQLRNFWDQTSKQWAEGTLIGKPASIISSSATQHGGQETTIITSLITLLHHGMIYVGLPYSVKEQMTLEEITGGSPYGASTIAGGAGERMPSELEKTMAREHAKRLTDVARKLMA